MLYGLGVATHITALPTSAAIARRAFGMRVRRLNPKWSSLLLSACNSESSARVRRDDLAPIGCFLALSDLYLMTTSPAFCFRKVNNPARGQKTSTQKVEVLFTISNSVQHEWLIFRHFP